MVTYYPPRRRRPAALEGLGDLGDTGIVAIDSAVSTAMAKVDRLVLATEIGTIAAILGAALGLLLLLREPRR